MYSVIDCFKIVTNYIDDCFDICGNTTVEHTHKIIRKINKTTGAECQSGR